MRTYDGYLMPCNNDRGDSGEARRRRWKGGRGEGDTRLRLRGAGSCWRERLLGSNPGEGVGEGGEGGGVG